MFLVVIRMLCYDRLPARGINLNDLALTGLLLRPALIGRDEPFLSPCTPAVMGATDDSLVRALGGRDGFSLTIVTVDAVRARCPRGCELPGR